ncbi:MAG TPA: hypothetical protein DDY53_03925 [Clostridiales bacterium]|nr:hypothetical protein [Clostridiales bacterium]
MLTKNVTDYTVDVTIDWKTDDKTLNANHSYTANADISVNSSISPNPDNEKITNTVQSSIEVAEKSINLSHSHDIRGKKKMTVHNALKKDDVVILIQKRGGQEYIVIDKIKR